MSGSMCLMCLMLTFNVGYLSPGKVYIKNITENGNSLHTLKTEISFILLSFTQ